MKDKISTIKGVFVFAATIIGAGILALTVAAATTGRTVLVVILPLVIALFKPEAFINALDIAGTYDGGMFVGILPVLMVLKSKKQNKSATPMA